MPLTLDGDDKTLGSTGDAAASSDTGSATLIALMKRELQKLTTGVPTIAATTGGATPYFHAAVAGTVLAVKATAGQVFEGVVANNTAAAAFLQLFNAGTAAVTLGTTAPTYIIPVAASSSTVFQLPEPLAFGTAISIACTTTSTGSTGASCDVALGEA